MKYLFLFPVILSLLGLTSLRANVFAQPRNYRGWKAGVARAVITPEQPMWMAGYASRTHPATGKITDLWAKALALEDTDGNRVVLVTMDLSNIPKPFSDRIRDQLKAKFHLSKSQIILNAAHNHSGPVLVDNLHVQPGVYPIPPSTRQYQLIEEYTHRLGKKIVTLAEKALHSMKAVQLYAGNGVTRFQINRRNNNEQTLASQADLNGPNDYAVPVIKVVDSEGKLMAVAFGYACHNTVLSGYKWSGDFEGFAQMALEKAYPNATALFFQGAGGDQNPLPRRSVGLAKQYGTELAAAVETIVNGNMRELRPHVSTAYSEVKLPLSDPPTQKALTTKAKKASGYQKRWAKNMVKKLKRGETIRTSYPYPVEVWKLGDQPIIALGGEVVIKYTIRLKQIFGQSIFVLGYCNDNMAYIPTDKILREGGYEATTGQMAHGLPATWAPGIETTILHAVIQVAKEARVTKPKEKIIRNGH